MCLSCGPQLETVLQKSVQPAITNIPSHVVHNQTATMLEIGTNLLTHTAEQTRKLNVVEAKVLNHTSRIEIQLLENSLSTNKLEKELLLQTSEISQLRDKNSRLESKVQRLESQQKGELEDMKEEKNRLQSRLMRVVCSQSVVRAQVAAIESLERQLRVASSNNTALQRQQAQLMESVHTLINMVATTTDAYKAGHSVSGLYTIYIGNRTEPVQTKSYFALLQVFCDMETSGGGWTVFQRRFNGSVDFQRSWREYKMVRLSLEVVYFKVRVKMFGSLTQPPPVLQGFGDVFGEHWLGNEVMYLLTSQGQYSLRVELRDWEGHPAHSLLYLRGYSGTAGRQSSLTTHGTGFSTRDQDNDNCDHCKCALMLTGGWWFDACGFSNLNGIYYTVGHNIRKLNGIKWHHFRGPSYSLRSTSMMGSNGFLTKLKAFVLDGLFSKEVFSVSAPVCDPDLAVSEPDTITPVVRHEGADRQPVTLPQFEPMSVDSSPGSKLDARLKVRSMRLQVEREKKEAFSAPQSVRVEEIGGVDCLKDVSDGNTGWVGMVEADFGAFERIAAALQWPKDVWAILLR
ncbi:hypothetical protein FQN60_009730, partial [Etheostoma spectabile]